MSLRDLIYMALFAAIVGIMAFFPPIMVPFIPVPITLQTLGVMLAGGLLGARRGGLSMLLFVALVAVGAPMLAGGRGGLGVLFGPGGGYVLAWPLAAFFIGYLVEKLQHNLRLWQVIIINIVSGIILVYVIGVSYLAILSDLPWWPTFLSSFVFLPGDLIKAVVASLLTVRIRKSYPSLIK